MKEHDVCRFRAIAAASSISFTPRQERAPAVEVTPDDNGKPYFNVGDYVEVQADLSPGMNRPSGRGFVANVRGYGAATLSTVKYDDVGGGRVYIDIPIEKMTTINFGWDFDAPRSQRDRIRPGEIEENIDDTQLPQECEREPIDACIFMLQNTTHRKRVGFRRRELCLNSRLLGDKSAHLNKEEITQLIVEMNFVRGHNNARKFLQNRKGCFVRQDRSQRQTTIKYLVEHCWGIHKATARRAENKQHKSNAKRGLTGEATATLVLPVSDTCDEMGRSIIDNFNLAKKVFTPKHLYVTSQMREQTQNESIIKESYSTLKATLSAEFDQLDAGNKAIWAECSRSHLAKQPFIKDKIIDLLQANDNASYVQLESSINNWCSAETIRLRRDACRDSQKLQRNRLRTRSQ